MKPSDVRNSMRSTLGKWFRIDAWSIGLPEEIKDFTKPPSIAREKPISELVSIDRPLNSVRNSAYLIRQKLSYQILYRLPNTLTYEEILTTYRGKFEDQTASFCAWIVHNPECLNFKTVDANAKVSCPELASKDWLLSSTIELQITYESTYSPTNNVPFSNSY